MYIISQYNNSKVYLFLGGSNTQVENPWWWAFGPACYFHIKNFTTIIILFSYYTEIHVWFFGIEYIDRHTMWSPPCTSSYWLLSWRKPMAHSEGDRTPPSLHTASKSLALLWKILTGGDYRQSFWLQLVLDYLDPCNRSYLSHPILIIKDLL